MEREVVGYLSIVMLLVLLGLGMPVGFCMMFIGVVGYIIMQGHQAAFAILGGSIFANFNNYAFTVMPLFVLMGHFAYYSRMGEDLFVAIRKWVGNIKGAIAMAACFGCAGFGTVSGDSLSTIMTIGKIAVPEMQKAKYDMGLTGGVMAAAGPIAAMIPPSGLMILYSLVTEQSVARLLMAGFLPGLLTAFLFALTVFIWTRLRPKVAPATGESFSFMEKMASLKLVWPIGLCGVLIIGGIYTGVFTPTEAGGMAALIVLVVGFATRRLNIGLTRQAIMDSAKVVGTVMILLVGSLVFNSMFTITGISQKMMAVLAPEGAPVLLVVTGIMMMYLVLGCFLSAVAMIFLTMPFVFPIVLQLGISPIWFGVLIVHMCELGSITPPFGITLFAVKAILPTEVQAKTLIKGALPFFATYMVVLVILLLFPNIALFLPGLMDA